MQPKKQYYENAAKTVIKNMERRGIRGYYCDSREAAVEQVLKLLPPQGVIGCGSSQTVAQTGVLNAAVQAGLTLIDKKAARTPEEKLAVYAKTICSDCYFMSTNAFTLDGELVNIDQTGSRVSCLMKGPKQVFILAGMNKLAADVNSAVLRIRNEAAPSETVRLGCQTPCSITGRCGDCLSDDCICGHLVVTRYSCQKDRIHMILIGEELGF